MTQLNEHELAIADGLLRSAVEQMPYYPDMAQIFMRWRMNWLDFAHIRTARALRDNYYPWADYGKGTKPHNRHDRKRNNRNQVAA